jgi:hypothetical protein
MANYFQIEELLKIFKSALLAKRITKKHVNSSAVALLSISCVDTQR